MTEAEVKVEKKDGYKKTKLGLIPIDWKLIKLSDVISLESGQHLSPDEYNNDGEGVPYFTGPTDFCNSIDKVTKWSEEASKYAESGDILITVKGSGVGSLFISDLNKIAIGRQLMAIKPQKMDRGFLYNFLKQRSQVFEILASGNMIPGLSRKDILSFKTLYPPKEEQTKIAEIFSVWDEAISKTEILIQAKKRYKKGLMQRLLSGKVRFPEFEGEEWVEVKLGEVFNERNDKGFNDLKLVAITTNNGVIDRDELERRDTSSNDKSNYKRILPGDIGYNTMRMWQGVSGYSELEGIVSPAYTIVTPISDKVDGLFMSYLFKHPPIVDLFRRYSQGLVSDTLNLKYSNFSQIKLKIPSSTMEQQKIASVFTEIDKEIDLMKKETALYQKQKKGLMQQLLTGKVRVN